MDHRPGAQRAGSFIISIIKGFGNALRRISVRSVTSEDLTR